jgi:hypothetical protein
MEEAAGMTSRRNPPGGQSRRAEGFFNHGCHNRQQPDLTPLQPENPTENDPIEPSPEPQGQPPITRARCWEDYDTKAVSCDRDALASDLNHDLAKDINQAIKLIDQSDPDQLDWYLDCHAEIFNVLDVIYLLTKEMDVTDREAKAIASATRKHVRRAMARWRTHQIELMEAALAFYDAAEIITDNVINDPPPEPPPKRKPASWLTWRHQGRART